jgi:hypothetical protein
MFYVVGIISGFKEKFVLRCQRNEGDRYPKTGSRAEVVLGSN